MRPRISLRGSVRPSVRPSIGNAFFSNARKSVFLTSLGEGKPRGGGMGDVGRGGDDEGAGRILRLA